MWYLLRHGKTICDLKNLIKGWDTSFLCLDGIEQSKIVSEKLLESGMDFTEYKLITSPATRARQTMAIVQESLGLLDKNIIIDELILPRNSGRLIGTSKGDLKPYDNSHDYWNDKIDDGESAQDVYDRVIKFYNKRKNEENLIIVSHWEVMISLKSIIMGIDKDVAKQTSFRGDDYAVCNSTEKTFEIF